MTLICKPVQPDKNIGPHFCPGFFWFHKLVSQLILLILLVKKMNVWMNEWMKRTSEWATERWKWREVNQYTNQVVATTKTAVCMHKCVCVSVCVSLPCKSHSDTCIQSFPLLYLHFKQLPTCRAETNIYRERNKRSGKKDRESKQRKNLLKTLLKQSALIFFLIKLETVFIFREKLLKSQVMKCVYL